MKKSYIISYTLNNYYLKKDKVRKIIQDISDDYVCPQPKTWIIKTRLTPVQITEKLKPAFDLQDHLLVFQIKNNFWGLQDGKTWDFIRKYIF